jgi:hypothetical protein
MAAQASPLGSGAQASGIVRITGRYRLPSDVVSELRHVLAENPQIVILDLNSVAGSWRALAEILEPVAPYLAAWPGTVLAICVPDTEASAQVLPPMLADRVLLSRTAVDGLDGARLLLERQDRTTTFLTPKPQAAEDARAFTRRTLRDWRLDDLIWPASLVVSELVTHSILKADTVLDLTLSRVGHRIRVAVHDYGSDEVQSTRIADLDDSLEDPLLHRGLMVVRAMTRCWGVFPSRVHGKTVWAVMQATNEELRERSERRLPGT